MRYYQAEASKFRPTDRMVAHTGSLVPARPVTLEENPGVSTCWLKSIARLGEDQVSQRHVFPTRRPVAAAGPAGGRGRVHPVLVRANELMQAGQYLEAAASFSRIAEVVRARSGPRAPFFFLAGWLLTFWPARWMRA